jgi:cyclophilin family peptidyl-prolyl cis-trans isomerase
MFKSITTAFALALLLPVAQAQEVTAAPTEIAPVSEAAAPAPRVALHTSQGEIVLELNAEKAPISVENFLQYVKDGHYNGTLFHRVIENFMIQGGGFTVDLNMKPTRAGIRNEANNGLSNARGSVAMARTNDPHSGNAQFFINTVDNPRLDFVSEQNGFTWGYAVFGKVVSGMDVVDRIRSMETGAQGPFAKDVPVQSVIIERAEMVALPAAE